MQLSTWNTILFYFDQGHGVGGEQIREQGGEDEKYQISKTDNQVMGDDT